jgi:hypothetical protein
LQSPQHELWAVQEYLPPAAETAFALPCAQHVVFSAPASRQQFGLSMSHAFFAAAQDAFLSDEQQAVFFTADWASCACAVPVNAKRNNTSMIEFFILEYLNYFLIMGL